jgi:hypothetical protein
LFKNISNIERDILRGACRLPLLFKGPAPKTQRPFCRLPPVAGLRRPRPPPERRRRAVVSVAIIVAIALRHWQRQRHTRAQQLRHDAAADGERKGGSPTVFSSAYFAFAYGERKGGGGGGGGDKTRVTSGRRRL